MKIKIPQDIKMATHKYHIEYNHLLWHEEGLKGSVNHIKGIIQVDPALAPSHKLVTLFHELLHIVNDVYRCKLDEDEVDKIAQGWAGIMDSWGIEFDWSLIAEGK